MWLICHNADTELANQQSVWDRIPLIESAPPNEPLPVDIMEARPSPRLVKTHLPVQFWKNQIDQSKARVIVVMRNPKDQVIEIILSSRGGHQTLSHGLVLGEDTRAAWAVFGQHLADRHGQARPDPKPH